jgi:hypothetical protein
MVVILFTTEFPSPFTDALEAEGLEVYEALAISEVWHHNTLSIWIYQIKFMVNLDRLLLDYRSPPSVRTFLSRPFRERCA